MEVRILQVLALIAVGLALMAAAIWFGQRRLIYRPETQRLPPTSEGLRDVAEVIVPTHDGEKLVTWYAPARGALPTVLYFHGNGGGLYDRSARIRILQSAGYGVMMLAYRGYSGSTGAPSEVSNIADAATVYDWLCANGVTPEKIVLFGESMGTGVAVQLAAAKPVAGVILDSPFTSMVDVAAGHFPFVPIRLLLRDRYVSTDHIDRIRAPLLVLHGEQDRVVPFALGQKLFAAAHEPKRFVSFPGVGHLVPFDELGWPVVHGFLQDIAR